jgi:hypothetical protein
MGTFFRGALVLLFSCIGAGSAAAQMTITWSTAGRQFRSTAGEPTTLVCPPASGEFEPVWGTMIYTDDSSVCTAAVHAGAIRAQEGGTIILRILPGRDSYSASRRNGVSSERWGEWETSFSVERAPAPPPPPKPEPVAAPVAGPAVITWQQTAGRLAPNSRRFTFQCPARGKPAAVKGRDLYSWDSSICTAAVHAGAITLERGGVVTIEMRPGARTYPGSERNGITTVSGEHTTLGFIVLPATTRAP